MKDRLRVATLAAVVGVAVLGSLIAAPFLPSVREARYRTPALGALEAQAKRNAALLADPIFLYHLGRGLNEAGRYEEAQSTLEKAAGYAPDEARIRDEWARSLIGQGMDSAAYSILMQFRSTHPRSAEACYLLGRFHHAQRAFAAAEGALDEAVRLKPAYAAAWSLLANTKLSIGNSAQAKDALATALRLRPSGPDSARDHLQMGSFLARTAPPRARAEFEAALKFAPNNAEVHREYARYLVESGQGTPAEIEAREAIRLDPKDAGAYLLLGRALSASGVNYESVPPLSIAARLAPWDPLPAMELARISRGLNSPVEADQWKREAARRQAIDSERRVLLERLRATPNDLKLHVRLAEILATVGDAEGCLRESALALKRAPDAPPVLVAAARRLVNAGRPADALPLVRQSLITAIGNPDAIETLGDTLLALGRLHEAAIQYERIKDLRPQKVDEYRRRLSERAKRLATEPDERQLALARAARNQGNVPQAEAIAEKVVAVTPNNTRALRFLLETHFALRQQNVGEREKALSVGKHLVGVSPEDGVTQALYAILLLEGDGSTEEADLHLMATALDPTAGAPTAYGRALLAKRQGKLDEAREEFRRCRAADPHAADLYPEVAGIGVAVGVGR